MIRPISLAALLSAAFLPLNSMAGGDVAAGEEKSQVCVACHAAEGKSENPIYPILAGQHADYIITSLKGYQSGERNNEIMKGFAVNLSEQDMEDLAAYFSSRSDGVFTPKLD